LFCKFLPWENQIPRIPPSAKLFWIRSLGLASSRTSRKLCRLAEKMSTKNSRQSAPMEIAPNLLWLHGVLRRPYFSAVESWRWLAQLQWCSGEWSDFEIVLSRGRVGRGISFSKGWFIKKKLLISSLSNQDPCDWTQ
jgi:hypothetical protein